MPFPFQKKDRPTKLWPRKLVESAKTKDEVKLPEELRDYPKNFVSTGDREKDKFMKEYLQLQHNHELWRDYQDMAKQGNINCHVPGTTEHKLCVAAKEIGVKKDHKKIMMEFFNSDPRHLEWNTEYLNKCWKRLNQQNNKRGKSSSNSTEAKSPPTKRKRIPLGEWTEKEMLASDSDSDEEPGKILTDVQWIGLI